MQCTNEYANRNEWGSYSELLDLQSDRPEAVAKLSWERTQVDFNFICNLKSELRLLMALEAFVTALACLSTTTMPDKPVPHIMVNSQEPFRVDNNNCPATLLQGLAARTQHMSGQLKDLRGDLNELQQLIDEHKREAPSPVEDVPFSFDTRPEVARSAAQFDDMPRNCLDQKSGITRIRIAPEFEPISVMCEGDLRDGGWLVIAYRYDGREDFHRGWSDYKIGFGVLNSEFFIGLETLHRLTNYDDYELYIQMRNQDEEERFALYDEFAISNEAEMYRLYRLGAYTGDAGNSLQPHAGKKFTTIDQDNDDNGNNCAREHSGGWWYGLNCVESNLFGTFQYKTGQKINYFKGILWKPFVQGPIGSLRYVRMMIRPKGKRQRRSL